MAANFKIQTLDPLGRLQINAATNPHSSGDICYEQGHYGIAEDNVAAGGSFRLQTNCVANVLVPAATGVGVVLYTPSQPSGAATLTTTSGGNVKVGITRTAADANNYADVQFYDAWSAGL